MKMLLFNERFLAFLFHSGKWHNPDLPNHESMRWINGKWREWLRKEGRPANDRICSSDHKRFDAWLRSLPRPIVFVDEIDAADVPELVLGKQYVGKNFDGGLLDVYDGENRIGTYCVERFRPA
jgi:hypothetical protein